MKQWVISSLQCKPKEENMDDVVIIVDWRRTCNETINDKSYYADVYGSYSCTQPSPDDFTPYDQLTYNQVCLWLDNGLDVEALDLNLDGQIENQVNPPIVVLPLPFVNP